MPRPRAAPEPASPPSPPPTAPKVSTAPTNGPPAHNRGPPLAPRARRQREKRAPGGRSWDAFSPGRREAGQGLCKELKAEGCGGEGN